MEIINANLTRARIRVAVFDFDGTLSLLRSGWVEIMHALMLRELLATPQPESADALNAFITDLIFNTSGQQTIYQMIRLTEEIEKRGGTPLAPTTYLENFWARLDERIHTRIAAIESGANTRADWLVPGAMEFLQALAARNVTCYIASGTLEKFVKSEAALLGIVPFFTGIHGAHADYKNHSKKVVINNLVAQYQLREGELVTFGDGKPEIADTKAVGGIGIGLATDEEKRAGVQPQKRAVLIQAGADVIVPDFAEPTALINYLFEE